MNLRIEFPHGDPVRVSEKLAPVAVMIRTLIPATLPAALEPLWLCLELNLVEPNLVESAMIADRDTAAKL